MAPVKLSGGIGEVDHKIYNASPRITDSFPIIYRKFQFWQDMAEKNCGFCRY
jgi:hypothetical protein